MHGRSTLSRRMSHSEARRKANKKAAKETPTNRIDVGDWSLAQDENGHLIVHNVMTGSRVVVADSSLD